MFHFILHNIFLNNIQSLIYNYLYRANKIYFQVIHPKTKMFVVLIKIEHHIIELESLSKMLLI